MSAPDRERLPAILLVVAIVAGLATFVVYSTGGQTQLEAITLATCLGSIGGALVLWAKRFMPAGPEVEDRGRLVSTTEEQQAFAADFEVGEDAITRRGLLARLLLGAGAALGAALIIPLRSFGPNPRRAFEETPWQAGKRVVDEAGNPIRRGTEPQTNGVLTVFPESEPDDEFAQTLLIRLPEDADFQPLPGREGWVTDDLVAYSKVCTHAGCPVGLYEEESNLLLCPCHQSTFDVLEHARPVFGPASVPLPQLPLGWNDDDELIALGDFSDPPGPGFWDQDRIWDPDPPQTSESGDG